MAKKLSWRIKWCIRESLVFLFRYYPCCVWLTLSGVASEFQDLRQAKYRLRKLREMILYRWPGSRAVGVWQRQPQSGGWHVHLVVNHRLAAQRIRVMALKAGFGTAGINFHKIDKNLGVVGVASYICRYLAAGVEKSGVVVKSNALVTSWGGGLSVKGEFIILGGMSELWARGKFLFGSRSDYVVKGRYLRGDDWSWFVRDSREEILRMGWVSLSARRAEVLLGNRKVRAWFERWRSGICPQAKADCVPAPATNQTVCLSEANSK